MEVIAVGPRERDEVYRLAIPRLSSTKRVKFDQFMQDLDVQANDVVKLIDDTELD